MKTGRSRFPEEDAVTTGEMEAALKKPWNEATAWEREARRAFAARRDDINDGPDAEVAEQVRRQVEDEMMAFEEVSRRGLASNEENLTPDMLAARAQIEEECAGPGMRWDGPERPDRGMGRSRV